MQYFAQNPHTRDLWPNSKEQHAIQKAQTHNTTHVSCLNLIKGFYKDHLEKFLPKRSTSIIMDGNQGKAPRKQLATKAYHQYYRGWPSKISIILETEANNMQETPTHRSWKLKPVLCTETPHNGAMGKQ